MASKNSTESDFFNSCLTFGLTQLVDEPTRHGDNSPNILDLVFASEPDKVSQITFLPGLSDHLVIYALYSCQLSHTTKITETITLHDKGNYSVINSELKQFAAFLLTEVSKCCVKANWLLFKNKIIDLFAKHVPKITVTEKKSSPLFNVILKRLNNKKKRLFRSAKQSNNACERNSYYATMTPLRNYGPGHPATDRATEQMVSTFHDTSSMHLNRDVLPSEN